MSPLNLFKASYYKYILHFKKPSGTSRGVLTTKETWFIVIEGHGKKGIGECGLLRGLSIDDRPDYVEKLRWACENINLGLEVLMKELIETPSIQFGLEQAFLSLEQSAPFLLFPSRFTEAKDTIHINGLIWMGDKAYMKAQIKDKIKQGFQCIKMKIGAIDFDVEFELLKSIRKEFKSTDLELRVDANGAFLASEALEKLRVLSSLDIHSIEQPIKQGQIQEMARLCEQTPLPIALDEELIGVYKLKDKKELLNIIRPQFIILKPSLIGGFKGSKEWIEIAQKYTIGWWITSALESNVGLNAIAQWTYTLRNNMPQGLGTGSLFTNNFDSPLEVNNGCLHHNNSKKWNFSVS